MSKYDQSWATFRRDHGLRWQKNYPSLQDFPNRKTALIIALAVFSLIALVVAVQYQNEAVDASILAEKRANQIGECLQGTLKMIETDDQGNKSAIVSKKAEEFKL